MKFLIVFAVVFLLNSTNGQQIHHQQVSVVAGVQHLRPVVRPQVVDQKVEVQQHQQNVVPQHVVQQVVNKEVPTVQPIVAPATQQNSVVRPTHHTVPVQIKPRMMRSIRMAPYKVVDTPGRCNFNCDQLNPTVCGFNGLCHREFENQCELNTYNCINTQKIFHIVDDGECINETTVKCYHGDM